VHKYQQTGSDLAISKIKLWMATWNEAWFGDETNSPAAGKPNQMPFKKEAVKTYFSS
jgi:hypothetical protein